MDRQLFWEKQRGNFIAKKGGWRIGKAVYSHGFSMMQDLVGHKTYFEVLYLNVIGVLPSAELAQWLEASYICMSWPDTRIWCNQIAALAGDARTRPSSACVAGVLASDSLMYGPGSLPRCMRFIHGAKREYQKGKTIEEIVHQFARWTDDKTFGRKPLVPGYARPVARGDERVSAMRNLSRSLGFSVGVHEALSEQLDVFLQPYGEGINIGGYTVAFLSDQGLDARSLYRLTVNRVAAGVQACYAETADNKAGSFLPLRCEDVGYGGVAIRSLPLVKDE